MNATLVAAAPAGSAGLQYDRATIIFHWLTAILVVLLFASAETWGFLPRGFPLRKGLQSLHISMGILLAAVFLLRLLWRLTRGRRLPDADRNFVAEQASKVVHTLLYALLIGQIGLGFALRWAQAEPFLFFGLFSIPTVIPIDHALARQIEGIHDNVAWMIIILAGLHAAAALIHHYWLRDGLLNRMNPSATR
jgi:cytochrome b561